LPAGLPPIQADPPVHTWTRRVLLPWFSHVRVERYESYTRQLCRELLDGFVDVGRADAAADFAKQIPVRVIGKILGIPEEMSDTFIDWVRGVLEFANDPERRNRAQVESVSYFLAEMEARRSGDGTDLISEMLRTHVDGEAIPDEVILGTVALTLIAGLDTTWSALGSMLWHLATHPDDTRRLVEEPELLPTAIEEMLRAYSPVTMARIVAEDTEVHGHSADVGRTHWRAAMPADRNELRDVAALTVHQLEWRTVRGSPAIAPLSEGDDHWPQIAALFREDVVEARRMFVVGNPLEHALVDQVGEPLGEHIAGDTEALLELVETCHAQKGVADDQQAPPLADDFEALADRAVHLTKAGSLHDLSLVSCIKVLTSVAWVA
jgi:hypothetical protein